MKSSTISNHPHCIVRVHFDYPSVESNSMSRGGDYVQELIRLWNLMGE